MKRCEINPLLLAGFGLVLILAVVLHMQDQARLAVAREGLQHVHVFTHRLEKGLERLEKLQAELHEAVLEGARKGMPKATSLDGTLEEIREELEWQHLLVKDSAQRLPAIVEGLKEGIDGFWLNQLSREACEESVAVLAVYVEAIKQLQSPLKETLAEVREFQVEHQRDLMAHRN